MNFESQKQRSFFRRALLDWYDDIRRDLPWRQDPDLYQTVVSEFMLQQTQVATVLPYFERWTRRFPDFEALARAPEDAVLKAWEGLGYYSRARNLHKCARELVGRAEPPGSEAEWRALPGIGPYTAAAIASIAQGEAVGVVDGNVVRILTRLSADTTAFRDGPAAARALKPLADRLVDPERPGDFNQAIMELGATVCRPKKPTCLLCPVKAHCAAGPAGRAEEYPNIRPRRVEQVEVRRLFAFDPESRRVLLERVPDDARRLAGQYQLPALPESRTKKLNLPDWKVKTRGISNQRIREYIVRWSPGTSLRLDRSWSWFDLDALDVVVINGPHRRWIREWLAAAGVLNPGD